MLKFSDGSIDDYATSGVEELPDGSFQASHAPMRPGAELLVRQLREPAFHQVEPRRVGRREMQMEAWAFGQPPLDQRRFVGAVVVQDEVDLAVGRHGRVDQVKKLSELNRPMAAVGVPDDLPTLCVERRKQQGRPMTPVGVRAPCGLTRLHRQQRLREVEGLNLRFLVHAQHQGMVGRIEIEPDDVAHLLDEQRVRRQREGLGAMRLQAEGRQMRATVP